MNTYTATISSMHFSFSPVGERKKGSIDFVKSGVDFYTAGLNHAIDHTVSMIKNGGGKNGSLNNSNEEKDQQQRIEFDDKIYEGQVEGVDGLEYPVKFKQGVMYSKNGKKSLEVWDIQKVKLSDGGKWINPPANHKSNCFGYVLTNGKYVVAVSDMVYLREFMLNNGYNQVKMSNAKSPRNGDVIQFDGHIIMRKNNRWHSNFFGRNTQTSFSLKALINNGYHFDSRIGVYYR